MQPMTEARGWLDALGLLDAGLGGLARGGSAKLHASRIETKGSRLSTVRGAPSPPYISARQEEKKTKRQAGNTFLLLLLTPWPVSPRRCAGNFVEPTSPIRAAKTQRLSISNAPGRGNGRLV